MNGPYPPVVSKGISVIVPVYNEEEGLPDFLARLGDFQSKCEFPVEIVLIDDGSTDRSGEILATVPHRVERHEANQGYGAAVKTGLLAASNEAAVIIDADGTYGAEDIMAVASHLDRHDMVVGARTGRDAKIPLARRPAKWMVRKFASWMVKRPIPDLNSGLRAFRRSQILKFIHLLPDGFSLTTTITVAFHAAGKKVWYQRVQYGKRAGASKFRPVADTWNLIMLILRTVVLIRPLNVFLPLSFILTAAALAVLVITKLFLPPFMDATFIVLFTTGIQMFVLGLIADLIVRINLWTH